MHYFIQKVALARGFLPNLLQNLLFHVSECFPLIRGYQYTRMQSERHIRLLTVHKDCKGHLIGKLVHKPLDDVPKFTAISYTWGNKNRTHRLAIGGRELRISKNAHEVLDYYASCRKRRLLWIDTVCVDQSDRDGDKGQQVRLMREIYNKAARVIIWLGSRPKVGTMQNLVNYLSPRTSRTDYVSNQTPKHHKIPHELLRHPYWSRVWVVQEIVAAREAVIFFNGQFYGWKKFIRASCSLHTRQERTSLRKIVQLEGLNIPHSTGLEKVSQIDRMRRHYGKTNHEEETFLPTILMKFFSSQATKKLDRIFAFLGISSAAEDGALKPDYSKSETEVFTEVARHSLRTQLPKLRFMYFSAAGLANNINMNWPSWVPDLTGLSTRLPFPLWDFGQYKAGGKTYSDIDFLPSDQIGVEGMFIDKIRAVSCMKSKLDFNIYAQLRKKGTLTDDAIILNFCESELRRYKEFWKIVSEGKGLKYEEGETVYERTGETLEQAFLRTLLCDASLNPFGSETCTREYSEQWLELINAEDGRLEIRNNRLTRISNTVRFNPLAYLLSILSNHGGQRHLPRQKEIDYSPRDLSDQTQLPLRMALSSFGRQFAVTRKGYMALVVPGVEVDDDVCVFSGAVTPHALRRDNGDKPGEKYRLVGDSYVHGFMDGKWFSEQCKQYIIIK
jgi:hypothetical protein